MNNNFYYQKPTGYVSCNRTTTSSVINKVYVWMACALAITGMTAYMVANDERLLMAIFGSIGTLIGLVIAEIVLVMCLSFMINRMSALTATIMFLLYSIVNGVTLSSVFFLYTMESIATTFFITAGTFGTMAIYGIVTRKDLSRVGSICGMALFGLILAMVVNLLLRNSVMDMVVSVVGVLIFTGLTAYDSQKIKEMLQYSSEDETSLKISVIGALTLYLDFVNMFLYLIRLFGKRSN